MYTSKVVLPVYPNAPVSCNFWMGTMDEAAAIAAILSVIREFNQQVPTDRRIPETPETTLFARDGHVDSLGLVNLILMVEERLKDEYRVALTLADERAMSQERNPFRSVRSLAGYICQVLNESNDLNESKRA
jgi:acyl carrier protein